MRKLSFFLAIVLVITTACVALGEETTVGRVSIDAITNLYSPTQLSAGNTHQVAIRYDLRACKDTMFYFGTTGLPVFWNGSNGYQVYSPDGANWVSLTGVVGPLPTANSATKYKKHHFFNGTAWVQTASGGATPVGPSTGATTKAGYYMAILSGDGTDGYNGGIDNDIALYMTFQTLVADTNKTMCIDTCVANTAWQWTFASDTDIPIWDNGTGSAAARCLSIYKVPDPAPVWQGGVITDNYSFNHKATGTYDLNATDLDGLGLPQTNLTFEFGPGFETGYGTLVPSTGVWSWSGPTVPQSGFADIVFRVKDNIGQYALVNFTLHVVTTNQAPTISCPGLQTISINTCKVGTVTVADPDNDLPLTVTAVAAPLTPTTGTITVTGAAVEYCPVADDAGKQIDLIVTVSDGVATANCTMSWNVIAGAPYQVELEKIEGQIQGQYADMFIKLHKIDITQGLGGFDFLVAYDASALVFQLAYEGDIYDQCNWEYFTYRFGAYGNCGNACPSGMLRVIGIAETNNGAVHPGCNVGHVGFVNTVPVILANLRFLVSDDRTLECQFVPVRFFWYDCGDNVLSNYNGNELYLSQKVFDFTKLGEPFMEGQINGVDDFPTYLGSQVECYFEDTIFNLQHQIIGYKVAKQNVDFQNGGVDIICADSIDAPGDVNLNGLAYEIADAVMFTNYFVNGLSAFGAHIDGSVAATDTNKDGLTLTVADLVYLIRVIIGDAQPYAKVSPVAARITVGNGTFSVSEAMGAAYVVVAGNATPTLLANNMEMKYAFNGQNTNILVFSLDGNSFTGDFLEVQGEVVSTEFATANGSPVTANLMPDSYGLSQNYPNPFNPTTTIKISIPQQGQEWKLNIYNVTGQLVESFSGVANGFVSVDWNASNVSSGVYFYKLTAGDFSATKKAVLLK